MLITLVFLHFIRFDVVEYNKLKIYEKTIK